MWFGQSLMNLSIGVIVLTSSEHLKTFTDIQSHLEIEEERLKMFGTPNVTLVAKQNRPRGNKNSRGRQIKKGSHPPQKGRPKAGIAKKQTTIERQI